MSKKQLPTWVKNAWLILQHVIPVIEQKFKSGEWSGRFRKDTNSRLAELELRVQQLAESNVQQQVMIDALTKEVFETDPIIETDAD